MSVAEAPPLVGGVLLAIGGWALAAAALRAASAIARDGLDRVLSAVAIAVTAACLQLLALGLVGLGSSPAALVVAALATLVAARAALPDPGVELGGEVARWWSARSRAERAALGAAVGALAAWIGWLVAFPYLGEDGVRYRLATVITWIQGGSPGSLFAASAEYATDAYPLGNELVLTWPMAISRSFVAASAWSPLAMAVAAVAGWHGLSRLSVPRAVAIPAIVAVCALPVNVSHLNEPNSDLPALAWAACAAALSAGASRRPGLLAPALLAAALAVGAKTTAAVPVVLVLAAGAWSVRGRLREVRAPIVAAAVAAAIVGGLWYGRNLVLHGSPLWPFRAAPWGDPAPPLLEALDHSLLERPRATLAGRGETYVTLLAGGLVLAGGALLAPLLDRSRAVLAASAAALLALLAYAAAPVTGLGDAGLTEFPALSLRYLLPAFGVCAAAVALAGRQGAPRSVIAAGVLAASAGWSIAADLDLTFPQGAPLARLAAGALAGAALALGIGAAGRALAGRLVPPRRAKTARAALTPAVVLAAGLALSLPADGYLARHARIEQAPFVSVPRFFEKGRAPGPSTPVSFATTPDARVAGDRLRRPLRLLASDLRCEAYRRRWSVLTNSSGVLNAVSDLRLPLGPLERCRFADAPLAATPGLAAVYPPAAR